MSKIYRFNDSVESPFKRATIQGIVHANLLKASCMNNNSLSEEQIVALVDKLKSRKIFKSKGDAKSIAKFYLREAKKAGCISSE